MDYIELKQIDSLYVDGPYACFQGYAEDSNKVFDEPIVLSISLKEITDNMDYWLEKRAKNIIKKEKRLLSEKKKLKKQIKLWKSQNI
jgi:hypothetical protein